MKKEFKPLAMKCTQEQFDAVKGKLENIVELSDFNSQRYLTNKFRGRESISNINTDLDDCGREIHETWNEKIFLEACGIENEEDYRITKEMILKYEMKDEFPEVFKKELVIGKWYNYKECLFCYQEDSNVYGFSNGNWDKCSDGRWSWSIAENVLEATTQEVETALIAEAKKRYKLGCRVDCLHHTDYGKINNLKFEISNECIRIRDKEGYVCCVYHDGIWAEIIPAITKAEAEKRLGVKIE